MASARRWPNVKIAHDMVKEKLMTPERAIESGDPEALNQLLQPIFDTVDYEKARKDGKLMATGLAVVLVLLRALLCSRRLRLKSWPPRDRAWSWLVSKPARKICAV